MKSPLSIQAKYDGSLKYTYYISAYITETFGLSSKRGREDYADWDASSARYFGQAASYVLPAELDAAHRAYDLPAPAGLAAAHAETHPDNVSVRIQRAMESTPRTWDRSFLTPLLLNSPLIA